MCYLCLDGDVDEAGHPLRRDCLCRGTDAGFVHLSCLTNYAAAKSKECVDLNSFKEPWERCPNCHQYYQNELRIDIATKFALFVRRHNPDNAQMQVEALYQRLFALQSMLGELRPVQKREAGVTANVLLSLIERMKNDDPPLHTRYYQFEANAYRLQGQIAIDEGTVESAERALTHFENN